MTRRAARNALLASAAGLLFLWTGLARSAAGPTRKELLAALPEEDRKWLTEYVAPIILPEEERLFLKLTQPHERERFRREFWARREQESQQPPLGPGYEGRYAELRRLADEVYDGWQSDPGRTVLRYGEPGSIEPIRTCEQVFRDLEVWRYPQGAGGIPVLLFYRFPANGPRRLWDLGVPESEIFAPNSCRQHVKDLVMDCPATTQATASPADPCKGPVCSEACDVLNMLIAIRKRQGNGAGVERERGRLLSPPQIPLEGLDRITDVSANAADPNAKPLSVTGPSSTVPVAPAAPVKKTKKELLEGLPIEERSWLTEYVAPIIQPDEEQLFLELSRPEHFLLFKAEFWNRRERNALPFPMGPGYRGRYEELRRLADETYDGWQNDAGRMVLRYGEPALINSLSGCTKTFRNLEIWTYRQSALGQGTVHELFYRAHPGTPRRLWTVGAPDSDVFESGSCRKDFPSLSRDCTDRDPTDNCRRGDCADLCTVFKIYEEIRFRQGGRTSAEAERGSLLQSAKVSTEELDSLRARMLGASFAGAPAPPPPVPSRPIKKKSRKELLADLPDEERAWLTDFVAPIIMKEEEELFLDLTDAYQREMFKKDFWDRRENVNLGAPYGEGFERRYEELRPRLESVYDGWRSDAGRMVLHFGEPAEIRVTEGCNGSVFRELEIWTIQTVNGTFRQNAHHLFYRPYPSSPRKLWYNERTGLDPKSPGCQGSASSPDNRLFQPGSCRKDLQSLLCDCTTQMGDPCSGPVCPEACDVFKVYQEILAMQSSALGGFMEAGRLLKVPEISTEGLDRLRVRFATTVDPNAKTLSVEGPTTKPRAVPEPTPTPEPIHALTAEEIRDRIVHLEPKYRQFLDLAGPLLTEDSLQRFLQMTSKDKDRFIKEFWKRRS